MVITAILHCFLTSSALAQHSIYNIINFGAKKNSRVNAQKAIQAAINKCANAGGGTVLIPAGTFYTATIYLKSNVNLHLGDGASLIALKDKVLYKNEKTGLKDAGDNFIPALIVANRIENLSITGKGEIKGQPSFFYTTITEKDTYPGWNENAMKAGANMERPWVNDPKISLVYISDCNNVTLEDISIIDSINWSCHIQWSQNVRISAIKIMSSLQKGVNADGLDIDGCKNVIISNSIIKTGDDAICLKTTKQGTRTESCEDILIDNCILSSSSCALKLGTESQSDFKRISFTNCTINQSNRGIAIIIRDGGIVSDVNFSNILMDCKRRPVFWWGNGEAFHFNVLKRNPDSRLGKIERVTLSNIRGTVEGTSTIKGFDMSSNGSSTINDIRMNAIQLRLNASSEIDKRATNAIEILNASNIAVKDVSINWEAGRQEALWQNAFFANNVAGLQISGFTSNQQSLNSQMAEITLNKVQNAYVEIAPFHHNLLEISGEASENIVVSGLAAQLNIINKTGNKKLLTIIAK